MASMCPASESRKTKGGALAEGNQRLVTVGFQGRRDGHRSPPVGRWRRIINVSSMRRASKPCKSSIPVNKKGCPRVSGATGRSVTPRPCPRWRQAPSLPPPRYSRDSDGRSFDVTPFFISQIPYLHSDGVSEQASAIRGLEYGYSPEPYSV